METETMVVRLSVSMFCAKYFSPHMLTPSFCMDKRSAQRVCDISGFWFPPVCKAPYKQRGKLWHGFPQPKKFELSDVKEFYDHIASLGGFYMRPPFEPEPETWRRDRLEQYWCDCNLLKWLEVCIKHKLVVTWKPSKNHVRVSYLLGG